MNFRIWHVLAVISGLVALGLVKAIADQSWPPLDFFWHDPFQYLLRGVNPDIFGGFIGLLILLPTTCAVMRVDRLHKRLDATGPVEPLAQPGSPSPWSLSDLGAVIAAELEPFNAVVFVDDRSRTMRIMIDPASSITIEQRTTGHSGAGVGDRAVDSGPLVRGRWLQVRWKQGSAPKFKLRKSPVSLVIDSTGRLIPRWRAHPKTDTTHPFTAMQTLHEGQRREISFTTGTSELIDIVDAVALRGGWAGQSDLDASNRRVPRTAETYTVDRRRTTGTAGSGTTTVTVGPGQSSGRGTPTGTETISSRGAGVASHPTNPTVAGTHARLVRVFVGVGTAVLAGCVLATVIGLLAGMVWWAGLIIIGSGLLFFLIFSLPVWLLLGRQRPRRSRPNL